MAHSHIVDFFTEVQRALSVLIRVSPLDTTSVKTICGLDVSYSGGEGVAAAVVWSRTSGGVVEAATFRGSVLFPYIPGLLYAREAPLILAALRQLSSRPHLLLVDGHGLAHPRRAGLASIVGLLAETPSIGVAKSLLHGETRVVDGVEFLEVMGVKVGMVLRGVGGRRYYVSVGHLVDVDSLLRLVGMLGYDVLKPLREAHRLSKNILRSG
ncbi:MAG: endonuclease V [Nitrososphaerota archaeon]